MSDKIDLIWDLHNIAYSPSVSHTLFLLVFIGTLAFLFLRKRLILLDNKFKIFSFYIAAFSFFGFTFYADYSGYISNLKKYQRGDFNVICGVVDFIESYPTRTYQTIQIDGVKLFTKKGGSNSFSDSFEDHFKSGDLLKIEYVDADDGIIKIYVVNEIKGCAAEPGR